MPTNTLIGFILTGVVLAVFLVWTAHELRRVKGPDDDTTEPDEASSS